MPPATGSESRARSTARVGLRYAAGLTFAYLLTASEVVAVVYSLSGQAVGGSRALLTQANLVLLVAVLVLGCVATAVGGYASIVPSVRWHLAGADPDADQRRAAINIVRRQSYLLLATWAVGGAVLVAANLGVGSGAILLITGAALIGGTSSVSSSLLFTQRISRPIIAAASIEFISRETAPGIAARLAMMWLVNSALPSATIVLLILCRSRGWYIPTTASLDIPIVVLSLVSVFLGFRALIVVAKSISDPVRDVVEAMAEVQHGRLGCTVDVYEQSEIGRLQSGFNRMVTGLSERDRLHDLFGRHVGAEVARLAFEADASPAGDVREVAVLFIDLAGSTEMAVTRAPREVADILNDFFRIVVAAVYDHGGMINKFQGDAALAVFGAPTEIDGAAAAALATARTLGANLRRLPVVDFGIGVSAGPAFAGNIGAENRYEYTVIGDPVNEAARLADAAKSTPERAMASAAAITRAHEGERRQWASHDSVVLRGRAEATQVSVPREPGDREKDHTDDHDR